MTDKPKKKYPKWIEGYNVEEPEPIHSNPDVYWFLKCAYEEGVKAGKKAEKEKSK